MKLGINTFFIMKFGFGAGLKFCQTLGVKAVEVAATGPATKRYGDADKLLTDPGELNRWRDAYANHGLELYSFSAHGAPLSPNKEVAAEYSRQIRQACKLMERIGVTRLVVVAGLPEGGEGEIGLSIPTKMNFLMPLNGNGRNVSSRIGKNMEKSPPTMG